MAASPSAAAGAAIEPSTITVSRPIHLVENHDEAYYIWRAAALRDEILVHIDAHHDMWWIGENAPITIADFICPALREDILREVYWVVPDRSMQPGPARRELVAMIRSLARGYGTKPGNLRDGEGSINVDLKGKRLVVTTLPKLSLHGVPVLLDIDVDYLIIPQVSHGHLDTLLETPWRWPADLCQGIRASGLCPRMVTVSSSVEGSYTPIQWKYLGQELVARLANDEDVRGYELLSQGAIADAEGSVSLAEDCYSRAAEQSGVAAAAYYRLARISLRQGRIERAREHYRRALSLDSTYATGFNNLGLHFLWQRRLPEADAEFRQTLTLDPDDVHAHVGMAQVALANRRWQAAIEWATRALCLCDDRNLDAHRCLGEAYTRTCQLDAALSHYERSLQLALHGHRPLDQYIMTCTQPEQLIDREHLRVFARIGRLRARLGDRDGAISCYRIAAVGAGRPIDHMNLALLELKAGRARTAMRELVQTARTLPSSLRRELSRIRAMQRDSSHIP